MELIQTYTPTEIRSKSCHDYIFNTRDILISASQGALVKGTVMGRITDSGATQYQCVPWDPDATDGSDTPVGILMQDVEDSTAVTRAAMFTRGDFDLSALTYTGDDTSWIAAYPARLDNGIVSL